MLPRYVERGGDPCQKQPAELGDVTAHGFVFDANIQALEALVNARLNAPTGARYFRPLGPWVVLLAANLGKARNASSDAWVTDTDVSFWVPIETSGLAGAKPIAFLLPYTFVSSAYGMAMGREIFGFNKTLADFQPPTPLPIDGSTVPLALRTLVVRDLNVAAQATTRTLFEVSVEGGAPNDSGVVAHLWHVVEHGVDLLAQRFRRLRELQQAPLLFLKQFRDAADPTRAVHQSIVQVEAKLSTSRPFKCGRLSGSQRLTILPCQSHPIAADLGLTLDSAGSVPARFGFWLDFDFELGLGQTLWTAR